MLWLRHMVELIICDIKDKPLAGAVLKDWFIDVADAGIRYALEKLLDS
jgi:hypothetical protein